MEDLDFLSKFQIFRRTFSSSMELSIFPLNFSIFCRTLRFSAEVWNFLRNFWKFSGKFDSSMEVWNLPSKMPDVLRKIGIFDGSLGFSAEVSNLPSKILIFRGTFESSAELFDFPRNQITTSAEEKIVQESFAVDSDFLNRLVAGPADGPPSCFRCPKAQKSIWVSNCQFLIHESLFESSEIGNRDRNGVFSVYTVFTQKWLTNHSDLLSYFTLNSTVRVRKSSKMGSLSTTYRQGKASVWRFALFVHFSL